MNSSYSLLKHIPFSAIHSRNLPAFLSVAPMASSASRRDLYSDVPLPAGKWWKNASAVTEYKSIQKTLELARRTQNLDTVCAHLKTRQFKLTTKKNVFDISYLLSYGLGFIMALGIGLICFSNGNFIDFGLFLVLLSFFHMWEYTYVSLFHPETLSYECTFEIPLINPTKAYRH